jgi:hypothetical protein
VLVVTVDDARVLGVLDGPLASPEQTHVPCLLR